MVINCLWNGEYGEHDVDCGSGTDKTLNTVLKTQEECYKAYIGVVVGDFTCIGVEYDWGRRDQRWTVKCNLCGEISYRYHTKDWRKGKGQRIYCHCRKDREEAEKQKRREERERKRAEKIAEKEKNKKERAENKPNYDDPKYIGMRIDNLTIIARENGKFIARCDCGNEILTDAKDLFTLKRTHNCKSPECPHYQRQYALGISNRVKGYAYERIWAEKLRSMGYDAIATRAMSDYGIDIIVDYHDGHKLGIQCKKHNSITSISAVQEVYSGGRYYDCDRFAVISESGFSSNAIQMAQKLGVYLSNGEVDFVNGIECDYVSLVPTKAKMYEIDGVEKSFSVWCKEYGKSEQTVRNLMRKGMSLVDALNLKRDNRKEYTVNGFTGTVSEICEHFGILAQTVHYRMKYRGMSLEEAVFEPKVSYVNAKDYDNSLLRSLG